MINWHALTPQGVLNQLCSSPRGLTGAEAARRRQTGGDNVLPREKGKNPVLRVLALLTDPMILVLLGAAALSLLTGGPENLPDAVIIVLIVVINTVVSVVQENSARKALDALQAMSAPHAAVYRDGEKRTLPAQVLVPGDIVTLSAGDSVPADLRILSGEGLAADESALTGESVPAEKAPVDALPPETPVAERRNLLYASTLLLRGSCTAVVVATGGETEVGRIAGMLLGAETAPTPLQKKMGELSRTLSALCLGVCAVTFGVGLLQGRNLMGMLLTAVSLAVAAIPEGLPAVVTIVLALGVRRLAKQNAVVRRLNAVETLGCAGVVCTDKTGTLTENRMTVTRLYSPGNEALLLTAGALCCEEDSRCTDPTERAILRRAEAAGLPQSSLLERFPRLTVLPFDSRRKLMSTLHRGPEGVRVWVKGAPDVLLERCTHLMTEKGVVPMTPQRRRALREENDRWASQALRVLAAACRDMPALPACVTPASMERGLTFLGFLGLSDPPRQSAKAAVASCRRAGIRPVMITGDHALTATAIAKELDILRPGDLVLTGSDLDFLPEPELAALIPRCAVFARVTPAHKTKIVTLWQKAGAVVAMTGDGVNDAPALRQAHIGCAMGRSGTDVARAAADIVLLDDNFATIISAVGEGRAIYDNILKAIHYLLSCNLGEILAVAAATWLRFPQLPLLPVQLLWLNLVTDAFPALALGLEAREEGAMHRPPRDAHAPLFSKPFTLRLVRQGVLIGLLTLLAYGVGLGLFGSAAAANTMAFSTLTFCQLFHALGVRSETTPLLALGLFTNRAMVWAFLAGCAMQLFVLCIPPVRTVFHLCAMTGGQWLWVLLLSLLPLLMEELGKLRRWKRP